MMRDSTRTIRRNSFANENPQQCQDSPIMLPSRTRPKVRQDICIPPCREYTDLQSYQNNVRINEGLYSLPATHTLIHKWNEPSCFLSPAAEHRRTWAGTHFPSHKGYEAELAWVAGYTYRRDMPARRWSPIPVPTDR